MNKSASPAKDEEEDMYNDYEWEYGCGDPWCSICGEPGEEEEGIE